MKHRISAGALVVEEGRILMVNHARAGSYDYWVAPGGGRVSSDARQIKFWYLARITGGALEASRRGNGENMAGVRFLSRDELQGLQVFPRVLAKDFWDDLMAGFTAPRHLGVTAVVTNEFTV